ncbi:DUF4870 family protein [Sneathiella sp.]|jgi:uncharacterized membrane protein|uniref:DUF4870 family protein n=1 Tax=Sneathiella sp. TaxID=1964365 RepID=UPI0039E5E9EE
MSGDVTEQVVEAAKAKGAAKSANLVYILYLASIVFGITGLIGVVMAYINRGDAPAWVQTHYQFQIRTFWIGILISVIGMLTIAFFIGGLILLGFLIWYIVRSVKGMKYLSQNQPHPNPTTWMW